MHSTHQSRGFTLLEVLITAAILTGVTLLVATTITRTQVAGRSGALDQQAHTLANNALESVRALIAAGATCTQLDSLQPTTATHRGTTFTTATALDFVRHLDTTSSVLAANSVPCEHSRAVRVHATVSWPDPLEPNRERSYDLQTSVRTVALQAPDGPDNPGGPGAPPDPDDPGGPGGPSGPGGPGGPGGGITVEADPLKVPHKAYVTLRWDEGDTLPIPHYVLSHPESLVNADDPGPTSPPSVAWDGPAPWLDAPPQRDISIPTTYGDPLELRVTRERENELSFRAQRDGEHELHIENVVGAATHTIPINVVMKPRLSLIANPAVIYYGELAFLEIANPAPWTGFDTDARIVVTGVNNPEHQDKPMPPAPVGERFALAPPTVFPAVYDVRAHNLWTDTYHDTTDPPEDLDPTPDLYTNTPSIECYGPIITNFTLPASVEEGKAFSITVTVNSHNVPDGTLTIERDGSTYQTHALTFPSPGDETFTINTTAGSAGRVTFQAHVESVMCRDETNNHATRDLAVEAPPPPSPPTPDPDDNFIRTEQGRAFSACGRIDYEGNPEDGYDVSWNMNATVPSGEAAIAANIDTTTDNPDYPWSIEFFGSFSFSHGRTGNETLPAGSGVRRTMYKDYFLQRWERYDCFGDCTQLTTVTRGPYTGSCEVSLTLPSE